ncbi:MAG: hypothetical protein Sylvanvirus41_3 [Sylvanvirus sp.]|uniref:Uncharacterized protein n=1 Tax=Sylvanvirus sp. TaxID=2487774 RepID=A0A3G5AJA1_9VIRU|nr:MAG: hypothetical protein Sylvanvirus41_3 [Sylvanvirus sp.]
MTRFTNYRTFSSLVVHPLIDISIPKVSMPSNQVNVWPVRFKDIMDRLFLITPAHVAIYGKPIIDDNPNHPKMWGWNQSEFLKDLQHLDWNVPRAYVKNYSPQMPRTINLMYKDLAWTEVNKKDQGEYKDKSLIIDPQCTILNPVSCSVLFRQPYDSKGVWDNLKSTLGSSPVHVYPSPNSSFFEAMNIGFQGISGAIVCSNDSNSVVGMIIRLGEHINSKFMSILSKDRPLPSSQQIESTSSKAPANENFIEQISVQSSDSKEIVKALGIIEKKIDKLYQESLRLQDLENLFHITHLKRSIILPGHMMRNIIDEESVTIGDIIKTSNPCENGHG